MAELTKSPQLEKVSTLLSSTNLVPAAHLLLLLFIVKSYTKYMTDRHTVRTVKAVKESTRPKHKHWI